MLLLGGCQSSKIPAWLQGRSETPQATAPPSKATRPAPRPAPQSYPPESIQFPFESPPASGPAGKPTTTITPVWPTAPVTVPGAGPAPAPAPGTPESTAALPFPEDGRQWPSFAPYLTRPQKPGAPAAVPPPRSTVPLPAGDSVRVALLVPLSGPNARLGQAMLNAAQLAVFNFADKRFELLVHDTRGSAEGASQAASAAIGDGAS
ncbi:MAG: ABC transporter substrate-binding protein, partial [Rhodospirillales bacterium]|nr:ABC transporter substrate-binding protein [Rhodospirillales bacterium]